MRAQLGLWVRFGPLMRARVGGVQRGARERNREWEEGDGPHAVDSVARGRRRARSMDAYAGWGSSVAGGQLLWLAHCVMRGAERILARAETDVPQHTPN